MLVGEIGCPRTTPTTFPASPRLQPMDSTEYWDQVETLRPIGEHKAYTILRDRSEAQDVYSDASVKAFEQLRTFDPRRSTLKTWLLQVVQNRAIDHYRRTARRGLVPLDIERDNADTASDNVSRSSIPTVSMDSQLGQADPWKVLSGVLNEAEMVIYRLHFEEDATYEEIAGILGLTKESVKQRVHRARDRARDALRAAGWQDDEHPARLR